MEPFELVLLEHILTVMPQTDNSFTVFRNDDVFATVVPYIDDVTGLRWEALGLRPDINYADYLGDLIGELIEKHEM